MNQKIGTCFLIAFCYAVLSTSISCLSTTAIVIRNRLVPPKSIGRLVDPVTAYIDSTCHFLIAFLSWCAVDKIAQVASSSIDAFIISLEEGRFSRMAKDGSTCDYLTPARSALLRAAVCGLLAVFIDLDHFIEVQSLSLDDFVNLAERPFFHNALIEVLFAFLFVFLYWTKWRTSMANAKRHAIITSSLGYVAIIIVAFTTQHNRDSEKRGFTFRLCRRNESCAAEWNTPGIAYPVQAIIAFCLILFCGLGTAY